MIGSTIKLDSTPAQDISMLESIDHARAWRHLLPAEHLVDLCCIFPAVIFYRGPLPVGFVTRSL
ncbi:MAG: hypothetical protein JO362_19050 [Streptomycetaceae bacterium]|nr:hypothetical protein [Streptomycetaceae bacterium]